MFTTPCFIRKNTPELRKKLKELGYTLHPTVLYAGNYPQFLFCNRNMYAPYGIGYREEIDRAVDCGTSSELFLAIAALRDDSDKEQYFTDNILWFKCKHNKVEEVEDMFIGIIFKEIVRNFHKATVKELIEHFKAE